MTKPLVGTLNFRHTYYSITEIALKIAILLIILLSLTWSSSIREAKASLTAIFQVTWGGALNETGYSVALDSKGYVYVAGTTESYGQGSVDVVLLKYDEVGNLLWQRTWGGAGDDEARGVAVDSTNNVYVAGFTNSAGAGKHDALLLKFDSNGNLLWARTWGGSEDDYASGLAIVPNSGDIYVTGSTQSFGAGNYDVFLLKFDPSGNLLQQETWGGAGEDRGNGITLDAAGNIYLTGSTDEFPNGGFHVFLLKFNSTGGRLWQRTVPGYDSGAGLIADSQGNIYITGRTTSLGVGQGDLFLLRFNSTGALLWQRTWGGSGDEAGQGLALDTAANVYVTGYTSSYGAGSYDIALMEFSPQGDIFWAATDGSGNADYGYAITLNPAGDLLIAGSIGNSPAYARLPADTKTQAWSQSAYILGNSTLGLPGFNLGSPSFAAMTPNGNHTYGGMQDITLFGYGGGYYPVACGLGYLTCLLKSTADLDNFQFVSKFIQFTATGTPGTKASITAQIPNRGANSSAIRVYIDQTQLPTQNVTITYDTTIYPPSYIVNFVITNGGTRCVSINLGSSSQPPTCSINAEISPSLIIVAGILTSALILLSKDSPRTKVLTLLRKP